MGYELGFSSYDALLEGLDVVAVLVLRAHENRNGT